MLAAGVGRVGLQGGTSFTPMSLFRAGEVGAWYDPSDLTTLYQDSAGTTPVTAVEQPVGLMLDKSKGLAVGANTAPASLTPWTVQGTASIGSGTTASFPASNDYIFTVGGTQAGKAYDIRAVMSGTGTVTLSIYGNVTGFATLTGNITLTGTPTEYVVFRAFAPGDTDRRVIIGRMGAATATAVTVASVTVKLLDGSHASQATAASRPVLSARYNLLTYTEQFDNAAWTKGGATVTANTTTAPDGTLTAEKIVEDTTTGTHNVLQAAGTIGATETFVVYAKAAGRSWIALACGPSVSAYFDISTGALGTVSGSASITSVGNGWWKCSLTGTRATNTNNVVYLATGNGSISYTGDNASGVFVWGADLRVTNDGVNLPAYQRVVTGTSADYDTAGFPAYLRFDGVDDWLRSTFTITQPFTRISGVRLLGAFSGLQIFGGATANAGALYGTSTTTIGLFSGATLTGPTVSAPSTYVVRDIHNDVASAIGVNGNTPVSGSAGSSVPGGITIGASSSGASWTAIRLYSLVEVSRLLSASELAQTEAWVNGKTKAY